MKKPRKLTQSLAIAAVAALACFTLALGGCGGNSTASSSSAASSSSSAAASSSSSESSSFASSSASESSSSSESTLDEIEGMMASAYAGQNKDSGEYYYWASNDEGSFVMLAIYNEDSKKTVSYVGEAQVKGNNVTVTDYESGNKIGFDVTSNDDGTVTLDLGDKYGKTTIEECDVSDVFDTFKSLDQYTEAAEPNNDN